MQLRILGNTTAVRIRNICTKYYDCNEDEFELELSSSAPCVLIKHDRAIDGKVIAVLSKDKMTLFATFVPAINGGQNMSAEDALNQVFSSSEVDIKFANIEAFESIYDSMLKGAIVDNVIVAVGKEPVDGSDTNIEIFFDLPVDAPSKKSDGNTDFKELKQFVNVRDGELLAKVVEPTEGTPGINLKGEVVEPKKGTKTEVIIGEGIRFDEETKEYYATQDGYIYYDNHNMYVNSVLEVKNVDFTTGNIDFIGTVVVKGDVLTGFSVKARDIIVEGICMDALLVAENSINILTGIKGGDKYFISAGGDISFGYSENAKMMARGSIFINKYAFNSLLSAGNRVEAAPKSTVAGGTIITFAGGKLYNLGTKANTNIVIRIGRKFDADEKLKVVQNEKAKLLESLDKISTVLSSVDMNDPIVAENPKIKNLLTTRELIFQRVELFDDHLKKIMRESFCKKPELVVENELHEGAQIIFYGKSHKVTNSLKGVKFYFDSKNMLVNFDHLNGL